MTDNMSPKAADAQSAAESNGGEPTTRAKRMTPAWATTTQMLAYVDAADELYAAMLSEGPVRASLPRRQREAMAAFAKACNDWAEHPFKLKP